MNTFLPELWVERIERLALGLEPLDAGRLTRIAHPMRVVFDEEARGLVRPRVARHASCLHALLYAPGVEGRVRLRFIEESTGDVGGFSGFPRRFVPRLISYPILTIADAELLGYRNRVRRPMLFPGAAYDLVAGSTGLRGRVERGGTPVRWARVIATSPGTGALLGRAHGDDRGEFLLILSSAAGAPGELSDPLPVRVTVTGVAMDPAPDTPDLPSLDPLWDLPEEIAPALDPADPETDEVSSGVSPPGGYTAALSRDLALPLGWVTSVTDTFELP